jgi:iron complex outermembrane receptor protein
LKTSLIPLLALLLPAIALAANEPVSEEAYFTELPRILTASRIAQSPLEAPAPVTVIDREAIHASGMTELHDLLRLVPGFLVADWPRGGPMVVNHGLGDAYPRRLLVMVDGYSMLDAAFGDVHWQDLSIRVQDVERIEVVRGPNQASFGANAYQGVVNIITRRAGEEMLRGEAVVAVGERDFYDAYARYAQKGEALDWRVSASTRGATNFRDLTSPDYAYGERILRQTLNAQAVYRQTADTEWTASLGFTEGEDQVGSNLYSNIYPDHERDVRNLVLQLGWRKSYAPGSEISLRYAHSEREVEDGYLYTFGPLSSPLNLDVRTQRDDLEFQQVHAFSDRLTGVWGAGLRRDQAESARYFYGLGELDGTQWQLFGNLDWRLSEDWLLHAGAMLENHYNTDTLFSPRLALNYFVTPQQSVRVSGGRGYRAPTMSETDAREVFVYQGVPLPPLLPSGSVVDLGSWAAVPVDPERQDFLEIGYVGRYPEVGLQVDARLFEERHYDMINTVTCAVAPVFDPNLPVCAFPPPAGYVPVQQLFGSPDKVYTFTNGGKNRVRGGDLTLNWRHPSLGRFLFSHAITNIHASRDDKTDLDAEQSAPQHATSLLWSNSFAGGVQASVGFYRLGDMKWLGDGDKQPAYSRVDLRLAKRLAGDDSPDEIALVLQNTSADHAEFRSVDPAFSVERLAFVTLRLGW